MRMICTGWRYETGGMEQSLHFTRIDTRTDGVSRLHSVSCLEPDRHEMESRSDPISCLNPSLIKELEHDVVRKAVSTFRHHALATRLPPIGRTRFLNGRAWPVAVGAEHAAIACGGPEDGCTALAFVKEPTCICRHRFDGLMTAIGTGELREKRHQRPRASLSNPGSIVLQTAAVTSNSVATARIAAVVRDRSGT